MKAIRGKETRAERALRSELFRLGVRYRKHYKRLPGTPDVVVVWAKLAIFVDGDFWHGNGWKLRGLPNLAAQFPTRTDYWVAKIRRNMKRDRRATADLQALGWSVLRFWESDVLADTEAVARTVKKELDRRRASQG